MCRDTAETHWFAFLVRPHLGPQRTTTAPGILISGLHIDVRGEANLHVGNVDNKDCTCKEPFLNTKLWFLSGQIPKLVTAREK